MIKFVKESGIVISILIIIAIVIIKNVFENIPGISFPNNFVQATYEVSYALVGAAMMYNISTYNKE